MCIKWADGADQHSSPVQKRPAAQIETAGAQSTELTEFGPKLQSAPWAHLQTQFCGSSKKVSCRIAADERCPQKEINITDTGQCG